MPIRLSEFKHLRLIGGEETYVHNSKLSKLMRWDLIAVPSNARWEIERRFFKMFTQPPTNA